MSKVTPLAYGVFLKFEDTEKGIADLEQALNDGFYFGVAELEYSELKVFSKCINLTYEELRELKFIALDSEEPIYCGEKDVKIKRDLWDEVMEE